MTGVLLKDIVNYENLVKEMFVEWANEKGVSLVRVDTVLSRILSTDTCSESIIYCRASVSKQLALFRISALVDNENKLSSYASVEMIIKGQGWTELVRIPGGYLDFPAMPSRNDINERADYLVTLSLEAMNVAHRTFF